jgi:hypothetical protein
LFQFGVGDTFGEPSLGTRIKLFFTLAKFSGGIGLDLVVLVQQLFLYGRSYDFFQLKDHKNYLVFSLFLNDDSHSSKVVLESEERWSSREGEFKGIAMVLLNLL